MIEVHNDPEKALSDGPQALLPDQFEEMMIQIMLIILREGMKKLIIKISLQIDIKV